MNKIELRKQYKQIRENIQDKKRLSEQITNILLSSSEYINAKVICVYVNFKDEVDTSIIIEDALKKGKTIGIPITYKTHIDFYKINSIEEIKNINKENLISPKNIDLMIVPGICFDLENNRIGFGKGYYDKYLSNKELTAFKIGICFKEQILKDELIDIDIYDVKMNKLICD